MWSWFALVAVAVEVEVVAVVAVQLRVVATLELGVVLWPMSGMWLFLETFS